MTTRLDIISTATPQPLFELAIASLRADIEAGIPLRQGELETAMQYFFELLAQSYRTYDRLSESQKLDINQRLGARRALRAAEKRDFYRTQDAR